jgi:hypothetical protein
VVRRVKARAQVPSPSKVVVGRPMVQTRSATAWRGRASLRACRPRCCGC